MQKVTGSNPVGSIYPKTIQGSGLEQGATRAGLGEALELLRAWAAGICGAAADYSPDGADEVVVVDWLEVAEPM
jgi:hypothetical protein